MEFINEDGTMNVLIDNEVRRRRAKRVVDTFKTPKGHHVMDMNRYEPETYEGERVVHILGRMPMIVKVKVR